MALSTIPSDVLELLETKLKIITANMVSGNRLGVLCVYADNALLTDLKDFRVEGRQAIDQHWEHLPTYKEWRLQVLETGGDAGISSSPQDRDHFSC